MVYCTIPNDTPASPGNFFGRAAVELLGRAAVEGGASTSSVMEDMVEGTALTVGSWSHDAHHWSEVAESGVFVRKLPGLGMRSGQPPTGTIRVEAFHGTDTLHRSNIR